MPRVKKTETTEKLVKKVIAKPASVSKKDELALDVFDIKGKTVGTIALEAEIFGEKVNQKLLAQAVRVYLANQRSGTASTKSRGEVQGSSRKIYKQKGTGRARHGSVRAPIFVHGGIAFGPKPRDYSLDMPKKMRRKALFSALSAKLQEGSVKVVDGVEKIQPKTKEMVEVLANLELNTKNKKILFVLPSSDSVEKVVKAVRNIEGVTFVRAQQMNTYEVLNSKVVLFMKDSLDVLKNTFLKADK